MLGRVSVHINNIMGNLRDLVAEFERDIGLGYFASEEDLTSQFAGRLKSILNYSEPDFSIKCQAIVTKKTTEEPTLGADILVVIAFDSPEITVSKGFLAQAKNVELGRSIGGSAPMNELRSQCNSMLGQTLESYVWLYSKSDFRVQRAAMVKEITTNKPDDAISHPFEWFFYDFLICMRGDPSINLRDYPRLQRIIEELRIPFVILISASAASDDRPRGGGTPPPGGGPPDLDALVQLLDGSPVEEWDRLRDSTRRQSSSEEEQESPEQEEKPRQQIWL